jgi:hypothetical protein
MNSVNHDPSFEIRFDNLDLLGSKEISPIFTYKIGGK